MSLPLSLRALADQYDGIPNEMTVYVNRATGEILWLADDDSGYACDEDEEDRARVEGSDDFVAMPDKFELHEYRIMQSFAEDHATEAVSRALCKAIEGNGAFRRFTDRAQQLGVIEEWYRYKARIVANFVAEFLTEHKIPFTDDLKDKKA